MALLEDQFQHDTQAVLNHDLIFVFSEIDINAFSKAVVKLPDEPNPVPEGMSAKVVISIFG